MRSLFVETSLPLLTAAARIDRDGGSTLVLTPDISLAFHDESGAVLEAVADRLDGSASVAEIAEQTGIDMIRLQAVLAVLAAERLAADAAAPRAADSPEDFLRAFLEVTEVWTREIFALPFWRELLSGTAPRELVLGWGIEFYHYVESANEYMAAGVASCRDDVLIRRWLAEHYVEEHDHSRIFLEGLVRCGLDAEAVRRAPPLASTRAIINYMNEVARSDSYAYAGSFAVMQSPRLADRRLHIDRLYDRLDALYPAAKGLFDAFRGHVSIDEDLGHEELVLARILRRRGVPDHRRRNAILHAARGLVEHFLLFFDGVHEAYGRSGTDVPRRALDTRLLQAV